MKSIEQKPQWVPIIEMVPKDSVGFTLVSNNSDLGVRLRPETTLHRPLESFHHLTKASLDVIAEKGFVSVEDILKVPAEEFATLTMASGLRNRLDNYLRGLLILPHSRFLNRLYDRSLFPVPAEREAEIVTGVEEVLEELRSSRSREVSIFIFHFGLHNGITRTLQEVGKQLEEPVTKERVRQLEARGFRILRHPKHYRQMGRYLTLPEASLGKQVFGAVLVKDLPELAGWESIYRLDLVPGVLEELKTQTSIRRLSSIWDLARENLGEGEASQLSGGTQSAITSALMGRVEEIENRPRRQAEEKARAEQAREEARRERQVRIGDPRNNLIPLVNLSPEQFNRLDFQPIEHLELPTRVYNSLKREDIQTIGELLRKNRQDLQQVRGFWVKADKEVIRKLAEYLELDEDTRHKIKNLLLKSQ